MQLIRPGPPPPTSLRRVGKSDLERDVGEQPYCRTNSVDVSLAKSQLSFLSRSLLVTLASAFFKPLQLPHTPQSQKAPGEGRSEANTEAGAKQSFYQMSMSVCYSLCMCFLGAGVGTKYVFKSACSPLQRTGLLASVYRMGPCSSNVKPRGSNVIDPTQPD